MLVSKKNKKQLSDLLTDRQFFIPHSVSNDINQKGERGVAVGVNGQMHFVPTGRNIALPQNVYCVLRDAGILIRIADGFEDFDPLYEKVI